MLVHEGVEVHRAQHHPVTETSLHLLEAVEQLLCLGVYVCVCEGARVKVCMCVSFNLLRECLAIY